MNSMTDYRSYLASLPLAHALWWFIENVSDDTAYRSEMFFSLRERVRGLATTSTPTHSERLAAFFDGLRATGTQLHGNNAQLATLVANALDIVDPDNAAAQEDAEALSQDLYVLADELGGFSDYPEDSDDNGDE